MQSRSHFQGATTTAKSTSTVSALTGGLRGSVWEDNRMLMTPIHSECFRYASENKYVQVRYAQADWQTRDTELILYLEVPGKPPLVGVGLTKRAVRCLRNLDRETRGVTTTTLTRRGYDAGRCRQGRYPLFRFRASGRCSQVAGLSTLDRVCHLSTGSTDNGRLQGRPTARVERRLLPNDSHREDNEGNCCNSPVAKSSSAFTWSLCALVMWTPSVGFSFLR